MKNLKLKFAHFSILVVITLSIFTASCEDTEVNLTCADIDYIALRALYLSTDGDNWTGNTGWMTAAEFEANPNMPAGTDLSVWYGISTNTDGCVTVVNLEAKNLSGNIPPEIGNLIHLSTLQLTDNQLSGAIPPEIGNLSNLSVANLHVNQLSGGIPPELGNLSLLEALDLGLNQLTGSIPPEIGNLSSLTYLGLVHNQLSGCYDSNLGNLCSQFTLPPTTADLFITAGNSFNSSWLDFCATGAGTCGL